jgi:hypothetical protein
MKLYDLQRGDIFRIIEDTHVPPDAPALSKDTQYWLGNIDGMYSFCRDLEGNVVHIFAGATVEKTA